MKILAATIASIGLMASSIAHGEQAKASSEPTSDDIRTVAPVLEKYRSETVSGDLWKRPGLAPRDRSIVTLAALIARDQETVIADQLNRALDNGLKPREISEIITHLAFYAGWGNAMSAVAAAKDVFAERKIGSDQLAPATVELMPLDEKAEANRAERVGATYGAVSQGTVDYTTSLLFRDLWLRPDLAPRDRSLVTVSALIAAGQSEQVPFHLKKAMDNGLTQAEAGEMLTQLAFYAGWPKVFSAMPVAKKVFEGRPN